MAARALRPGHATAPPALAALAAAVALAGAVAWSQLGRPAIDATPASRGAGGAVAQSAPGTPDLDVIATWPLFGTPGDAPGAAATPPPTDGPAPETTLALVLRGILHAPTGSRAIIGAADGRDHEYAVGDSIPGPAVLADVAATHVVLMREGRREALSLPGPDTVTAGAAVPRSATRGTPSGLANRAP